MNIVYWTQSVWFVSLLNEVRNILHCSKHLASCTGLVQIRSSSSFKVFIILLL